MQIKNNTNPAVKESLLDTVGRINGMKTLYEHMTKTSEYKGISTKKYFLNLVDSTILLYSASHNIKIKAEIDEFIIEGEKLFLMAIIVNELVSNSIKYAFNNISNPEIFLKITNHDNCISVSILDNGNGLPENFDIKSSNGFGLRLVKMICDSLNGSFTLKNSNDSEYSGIISHIEFSITD